VSLLIDLLLLIDAVLSWSTVDQQEKTTNDRQYLEEIVLGEILVGVVLVKLVFISFAERDIPSTP